MPRTHYLHEPHLLGRARSRRSQSVPQDTIARMLCRRGLADKGVFPGSPSCGSSGCVVVLLEMAPRAAAIILIFSHGTRFNLCHCWSLVLARPPVYGFMVWSRPGNHGFPLPVGNDEPNPSCQLDQRHQIDCAFAYLVRSVELFTNARTLVRGVRNYLRTRKPRVVGLSVQAF